MKAVVLPDAPAKDEIGKLLTFAEEVYTYRKMIYGTSLKLTKHVEDAEDLTQTVLYKAIKNEEYFTKGTSLKAWVTTILRNAYIQERRRFRHQYEVSVDEFPPVERLYPIDLDGNKVQAAICELPKNWVTLLMMKAQGHTYESISEELGIPVGTIKTQIHKARRQLKSNPIIQELQN